MVFGRVWFQENHTVEALVLPWSPAFLLFNRNYPFLDHHRHIIKSFLCFLHGSGFTHLFGYQNASRPNILEEAIQLNMGKGPNRPYPHRYADSVHSMRRRDIYKPVGPSFSTSWRLHRDALMLPKRVRSVRSFQMWLAYCRIRQPRTWWGGAGAMHKTTKRTNRNAPQQETRNQERTNYSVLLLTRRVAV